MDKDKLVDQDLLALTDRMEGRVEAAKIAVNRGEPLRASAELIGALSICVAALRSHAQPK